MAGFKAAEEVEALTYDFNPHADVSGTIPEPSSKQIETFRNAIMAAYKSLGIDPAQAAPNGTVSFEMVGELLEKSSEVEEATVIAVARLTGIDQKVLSNLPYRVKAAFTGWIMGQFLSPEA